MNRVHAIALAALAVSLAACGGASAAPRHRHATYIPAPRTLLVRPDGSPVGGVWQQWVDQARVPTPSGLIVLQPVSVCGGVACSSFGAPWTIAAPPVRDVLYFEMGHIFDARYLQPWARAYLARRWGQPHARWSSTWQALGDGAEDGLSVQFAYVYSQCAMGATASETAITSEAPPIDTGPWACRLIRSLG